MVADISRAVAVNRPEARVWAKKRVVKHNKRVPRKRTIVISIKVKPFLFFPEVLNYDNLAN